MSFILFQSANWEKDFSFNICQRTGRGMAINKDRYNWLRQVKYYLLMCNQLCLPDLLPASPSNNGTTFGRLMRKHLTKWFAVAMLLLSIMSSSFVLGFSFVHVTLCHFWRVKQPFDISASIKSSSVSISSTMRSRLVRRTVLISGSNGQQLPNVPL